MEKQGDGTYEIYIERMGDIDWNAGAWFAFTYDPTTKVASDIRVGHYWDDLNYSYRHNVRYDANMASTGLTSNLTINSIDVNTGDISLKYQASATADYTNAVGYSYVPYPGKAVSSTFEFAGKLRVFNNVN